MKTILLTGATGFLGSHLLEALLKKGYKIVILKRSTSDLWRIEELMPQVISYDVDVQPLELAFKQQHIDCVMHTACHYGRNDDSLGQIVETNLMFGLKIIDASLKFNTAIFINTDTLLNKYLNVYSLSKKQFVEWLQQASDKIQVINLKLEHMYGPKDDSTKFVPWVLSQLQQRVADIKLTKGEQQRDFIYIDDVVSAFLIALEKATSLKDFSEFDVGTGQLVSVKNFLEQLKVSYEATFSATVTKLAFGAIPYRPGEMMTVEVNNKPLLDLGWEPKISFEKGTQKFLKSFK